MRENLLLHKAQLEPLNDLSFEQKGQIFDAIIKYQFEGERVDLSEILEMAFRFIKNQLDIDNQKYEVICERNRKNGAKGGRPKENNKPSGLNGNPENPDEPKKPDNDNDNDNDLLFVRFWDLYDKKKGKQKVVKLWKKLNQTDIDKIFKHLPEYKLATPDKQFRKDPATYLRNKAWEDEIIQPTNGHSQQKINSNEYKPGY